MALVTRLLAGKSTMQVSDALTGTINLPSAGREVGDFELISSITLNSSQSSIVFGGIPQNYKHLQLRLVGRDSRAVVSNLSMAKFNGDATSSNYKSHGMYGDGATVGVYTDTVAGGDLGYLAGASATAGVNGTIITDIFEYSNTSKAKSVRSLSGIDNNGGGIIASISFGWFITNAISSIELVCASGTSYLANTNASLYGVRG